MSAHGPSSARSGRRRPLGIALLALTTGCIIPDKHIDVQQDFSNPGPVRIIQPIPMTAQADEACRDASELLLGCPVPPDTLPLGLIDPDQGQLCVCPERDDNALQHFDIYVEDPDFEEDEQGRRRAKDTLLGAFLLDVPPEVISPDPLGDDLVDASQYVAYENYLSPTTPARTFPGLLPGTYRDAIERPTPLVRSWTIGQEQSLDLCNDDNKAKLEPGLHTLTLVVTDRPWYVPVKLDDGEVQRDREGNLVRADADPRLGVPDLPAGASYAVGSYVFRCRDGTSGMDMACNCSQEEP